MVTQRKRATILVVTSTNARTHRLTPKTAKSEDLRNAHRVAADAKARIAVYGRAETIKSLSRCEEAGAVITDRSAAQTFISLVTSMRTGGDDVPNHELEMLLLGTTQRDPRKPGSSDV